MREHKSANNLPTAWGHKLAGAVPEQNRACAPETFALAGVDGAVKTVLACDPAIMRL